jgi:predicted permease
MLFTNVVLPVFMIVFLGLVLSRKLALSSTTLTNLSLYILTPALVFSALLKNPISIDLGSRLALYMALYTALMLLAAWLATKIFGVSGDSRHALYLASAMMNIGNFGLPLVMFAYGSAGFNTSIIIFVLFTIPLGTIGIVLAQGKQANLRSALINTGKIPIFHAVILAILLQGLGVNLPAFILNTLNLVGQAAIPIMLILLGMQLSQAKVIPAMRFLTLATLLRLVVGPAVGWGLTYVLGITGIERNVVILQTSTPAAVLPLLYALRFNARPDLVASSIFVTTLCSAGTLTLLLYLLEQF